MEYLTHPRAALSFLSFPSLFGPGGRMLATGDHLLGGSIHSLTLRLWASYY